MAEPDGVVIALDLGGTWIKATVAPAVAWESEFEIVRRRNPLDTHTSAHLYAGHIVGLCRELAAGRRVQAVVASTAGEVDAAGRQYRVAALHLKAMGSTPWRGLVDEELGCPVTLINDAEAFVLGLAESGMLPADQDAGAVVVGTGLGFSVVRHGRWWKPRRRLVFLGSALCADRTFDQWASAVGASGHAGGDLVALLSAPKYGVQKAAYLEGLARMLATAAVLQHLDVIFLGGGLADAAVAAGLDLADEIGHRMTRLVPPGFEAPRLTLAADGNRLILRGSLALAAGTALVERARYKPGESPLVTENAEAAPALECMPPEDVAHHLLEAEEHASRELLAESPAIGRVAARIAEAVGAGGRVIYVGAGTSGRIGALDAVEIPCTFGLSEDRFVALVAGGVADAALSIESEGEEDISAVPDMVLLQPGRRDVVIGLSASGSAFFVRSALAFARWRGAWTVMVHESGSPGEFCCDDAIRLHSGPECVAGSTRMKAGTATKKVLNVLSTAAMAGLGKIRRGRMICVAASNEKLRRRAVKILAALAGLDEEEAERRLAAAGYRLQDVLEGEEFVRKAIAAGGD